MFGLSCLLLLFGLTSSWPSFSEEPKPGTEITAPNSSPDTPESISINTLVKKEGENGKSDLGEPIPGNQLSLYLGGDGKKLVAVKIRNGKQNEVANEAKWEFDDPSIASVTGRDNQLLAKKIGETTLIATLGGMTSEKIRVTVKDPGTLKIEAETTSIPVLVTLPLIAKVNYKDEPIDLRPDQLVWTSSNTEVATINKRGELQTLSAGNTKITASLIDKEGKGEAAIKAELVLTVIKREVSSIKIEPSNVAVTAASYAKFTARGTFNNNQEYDVTRAVEWFSSSPDVAVISNGTATILGPGTTIVSASYGDKKSDNTQSATLKVLRSAVPLNTNKLGVGDTISLDVYMRGFIPVDDNDAEKDIRERYAPAGTKLRIDGADSTQSFFFVHAPSLPNLPKPTCKDQDSQCEIEEWLKDPQLMPIRKSNEYKIKQNAFDLHGVRSAGLEYGILVVPYKFHLTDHSMSPGGTIGAYFGWHVAPTSVASTAVVISAGLGSVSFETQDAAGNKTKVDHTSLSLATGVVATFNRTVPFQLGLLFGYDWAGKNSNYVYEGKPWIALSFGASLTSP